METHLSPCPTCHSTEKVSRRGSYRRACDSKDVPRFLCSACKKTFSAQTESDTFRHRKTRLTEPVRQLLVCGVSRRQIARTLKTTRKTVERKLDLLAVRAGVLHEEFVAGLGACTTIQFDEMESFEHTKCKPLSIPLVVTAERFILAAGCASQPAKGPLAKTAYKKYGPRADLRAPVIHSMLASVKNLCVKDCVITTDMHKMYPGYLKKHFPGCIHKTTRGGRSCIAGYGELKKKGFDPIFALNHTAAMLRDHLATLKRRTWTTTKKPEKLLSLIKIYTVYHNQEIAQTL